MKKVALFLLLAGSLSLAQTKTNLDTQVKGSRLPSWGTDSGAANAYIVSTIAPAGPTLQTGSSYIFAAAFANSSASTANVDGTGVKAIKKMSSGSLVALASGDISAGQIHILWYDGTQYQCVTCVGGGTLGLAQTPLTTLGDILYVNSTPALARLAGQITTTKKYLSQTGTGSISAAPAWAQVAFSDLSGTLACAQMPTLTGDVSNSLCAITLLNIPSGTTMAGSVLATNISAPSTPASGKTSIYVDSTDKRFHDKNDAGSIGTTVVADTGASNNFLSAISPAGVISKSQPSFLNLSGTADLTTQVTGTLPVANGGTGVTAAQGSGSKVQLANGGITSGNCLKYDAGGSAIDSGISCPSNGGGGIGVPQGMTTQPDWPPASPNAMDDEFTTSTFNGGSLWTGVNFGSCTTTQGNDSWLLITCPTNGNAQSMRMQCQTLPSAPYTFETKWLADNQITGLDPNVYSGELILRESGTGKLISAGQDAGGNTIRVVYWSSSTVDVSVLYGPNSITWLPVPIYFTVNRTSTTLTWKLSRNNGVNLKQIYTESLTSHFTTAPDQVCIGISPYGTGTIVAYDFFRRTL